MKKISKLMFAVAATVLAGGLASCGEQPDTPQNTTKVAMITDYGDITDESFNQAAYEGCKEYCDANKVEFKYFKPANNSDALRIESTEKAIDEGYNVIVMPGYAFAPTIDKVAEKYADVKFIALDVAKGDLLGAHYGADYNYDPEDSKWAGYRLPSNVYCAVYQEELCGYMAGYAAVKEGYTNLAFLGGMSVPAVVRYGYGFVQGCDAAAEGKTISIKYAYGNQFFGDADIKARTDTWYKNDKVQVVFACGGGIYTSACESAQEANGKVIGVDVDQSFIINKKYGAGMCVTSAMKGLSVTVKNKLTDVITNNKWTSTIETLGLVSGTNPAENYVQLPMDTWSMKNYTVEDYKALVKKMYDGSIKVSNNTNNEPTVAATTSVEYQGNIK